VPLVGPDTARQAVLAREWSTALERSWSYPEALSGVKPSDVLSKRPRFRVEKAKLKAEWGAVRWWDLVGPASGVALGATAAVGD
jgi:hypothetical protein